MTPDFVLDVQGLSVGYRGRALIRDIGFSLPRGSILTLIGPNGAGKSTILKTITRQLSRIAGTAYLDGREIAAYPQGLFAKRLAVVLTQRVQPEMMSCFEVAAMGRYPHTGRFGALSQRDREIVYRTLERVHALELSERDFTLLSDGQRQRVLLARALCQEPEVLVLDEPTSFLDIRYKIELLGILQQEARQNRLTVVLSLHEIDLAEKISDFVMCVKGDVISAYGPPQTVFADAYIKQLYGLEDGCYLCSRGSVELKRPEGASRVFVVGGAGFGLRHYRALQRRRVPFSAGVLFENDREFEVAKALGNRIVSVPAFEEMGKAHLDAALDEARNCGCLLDAGAPTGALNRPNAELLSRAAGEGLRIIKEADELD